jgi:exosortase/archaeosortase family protein
MSKRSRTERRASERQIAKQTAAPAPSSSAFDRLRSTWALHSQQLSFTLAFLGCAGALSLVYAFPYAQDSAVHAGFTSYLAGYARAAGGVLALFDSSVHVEGATIFGRFSMQIVKDCDAMEVNILFASAVLAFPVTWSRRALGVLLGVVLLAAANLTRIASLYFIGVAAPGAFETAHRDVFPLLLIGVAVVLFATWVRWAGGSISKPAEQAHAVAP